MKHMFFRRTQLFLSLIITFGSLTLLLIVLCFTEGVTHFIDLAVGIIVFGLALALLTAVETLSVLHLDQTGISCTVLGVKHWNCRWDDIQAFEFGRGYFAKVIKISFTFNEIIRHEEIEITNKILRYFRNSTTRNDIRSAIDSYMIR